jgi:hypothetical protein
MGMRSREYMLVLVLSTRVLLEVENERWLVCDKDL